MNKGKQVTDQTLKGAILGAITYILARSGVDEGLQASLIPLVAAVLAYASTCVGDKNIASFISRASKKDYSSLIKAAETVIETVQSPAVTDIDKGAAPAKKAPVKKAAAPKAPVKKAAKPASPKK